MRENLTALFASKRFPEVVAYTSSLSRSGVVERIDQPHDAVILVGARQAQRAVVLVEDGVQIRPAQCTIIDRQWLSWVIRVRFDRTAASSGLALTADMRAWPHFVATGQQTSNPLFDHLVGARKQR